MGPATGGVVPVTAGLTAERFSMAVPGDWTVLPLDAKNRDRRIAGLVERLVGKSDRVAHIRRQTIVQLRKYAADAAERGAFFAAMHSRVADGLPMSATVMVSLLPQSTDAAGNVLPDAAAMAATLASSSERSGKGEVTEHSVVDLQVGQAARVRRRTVIDGIQDEAGQSAHGVSVDFFIPLLQAERTLALVFSTPILPLADAYAELFDLMAASAKWLPAREGQARPDGPERREDPDR